MHALTGIIIKKQNKGEHDQIITAYSKEYGKIALVARGVRKGSAKLSGHLSLLHLSTIGFVPGRQTKVLTTVSELESFPAMKKNLEKAQAALHIAHVVDAYTIEEAHDEDLFHLLLGALDYLNRKEMKRLELKFFLRYFEFKFLSVLGYEPEDKTIVYALGNDQVMLSEKELDKMALDFGRYFQNIYPAPPVRQNTR
ncbi:DNA repair protein RecO [Candidatus Azambacteria bacterium RIFCSPHIGHO2_02_FULL_52_12]|uniref:DNA repair protein RecO n=1 Tax=Candidatus Azambacteria bacterium RIFCSPLOWO2_01_FULL_46_25 TaxID=1797298 RepID=A0A1F5BUW6_9BACT|nr:MAG: DNA repair protein RecO [Candidatus Azambacteria bacterium RIFCSPHIGHO2_02_FULL_52_12]OGD34426.1 MAG: DNA repair protein RecO [Candidatus Azambacteria bacterium RIFCSPLOWO2_01_FULL_46_25]OGD37296.1 MAG: DNA repair protein RecO [Candidatus Azambacteria bacterium RIFCSPHIGHO2_01_FULL_51_74]